MRASVPAYRGEEEFFFVSHSNANRAVVQGYLDAFHRHGYRFWYDFELTAGKSWAAELEERIRACRFLLVFVTEESIESEWVRKEINLALELRKPVLCVNLERAELRHGLALQLRGTQGVNAFDLDRKAAGGKLQEAIDAILEAPATDAVFRAPTHHRLLAPRRWPALLGVAAVLVAGAWLWSRNGDRPRDRGANSERAEVPRPPIPEDFTVGIAGAESDYRDASIAVVKLFARRPSLRGEFAVAFAHAESRCAAADGTPVGSEERLHAQVAARDAMRKVREQGTDRDRDLARAERAAAEGATRDARDRFARSLPRPPDEQLLKRHCGSEYGTLRATHNEAQEKFEKLTRAAVFDATAQTQLQDDWNHASGALERLLARARRLEGGRLLEEARGHVSSHRADEAQAALRRLRELISADPEGEGVLGHAVKLETMLRGTGTIDDFVSAIATDLRRAAGKSCRDIWLDFEQKNGLDRLVYERLRDKRSQEQWRLRTRRRDIELRVRIAPESDCGATWWIATYAFRNGARDLGRGRVVLLPAHEIATALAAEAGAIEDEPGEHERYCGHLVANAGWPRGWWPPSEAHANRISWKRSGVLVYSVNGHETEMTIVTVGATPCLVDRVPVTVGRYHATYLGERKHLASVRKHWRVENEIAWPADRGRPLAFATLDDARRYARTQGLELPTKPEWKAARAPAPLLEWCTAEPGQEEGRGWFVGAGKIQEVSAGAAATMSRRNIGFRCVLRLVK